MDLGMHDAGAEWWYFTGLLSDSLQNQYFFQFTLFQGTLLKFRGFAAHLALTDLSSGYDHFEEQFYILPRKCKTWGNGIVCKQSSVNFSEKKISFSSSTRNLSMELTFDMDEAAVWYNQGGIISMGDPGNSRQDSYYFSYPRLKGKGWFRIDDPAFSKEPFKREVIADAWFDKQWGNFEVVPWQWFSLRFDSGDRAVMFYFPVTGHKEGYLIRKGVPPVPMTFALATDTVPHTEEVIELNWTATIPSLDDTLSISPLIRTPYRDIRMGLTYWEGLCTMKSASGENLGHCIAEIVK
jgi:predicted secreted hydrolase